MNGMEEGTDQAQGGRSLLELPEVKEQIERVRVRIEDLDAQARRVVQDRPLLAVGTALLFGYALGRLLARH